MQRRTLIRSRDLAAFREALIARALDGTPLDARRRAVLVPTRAAAELLRQSIETRLGASRPGAVLLPDFVTRAELIERLQQAIGAAGDTRPLLTRAERELLLAKAATATAARSRLGGAPFPLRPNLIAAMLDFYDELRRRQRTVRRFAGSLFEQLSGERGTDRGSEGLIHQTAFLGFAFLAYERAVRASGAMDEHMLRATLLDRQPHLPYSHLVIAVADHPSDPRGLWPADFDLVGRLAGFTTVEVVVTDGLHDIGFRERLESELPGIEEDRWTASYPSPVLQRPQQAASDDDALCVVSRDREEELRDVVRVIRHRAEATGGRLEDATAIVFHRPLPYLYLAQQVLAEARVPYQAFDALPLAAEPYAALLDVVMTAARTGVTRDSAGELLRSGLLSLEGGDETATPGSGRDVALLAEILSERRASGEASTFRSEVERWFAAQGSRPGHSRHDDRRAGALRAASAAAGAAAALAAFREGASAAEQIGAIATFLRRHERLPAAGDPWRERHLRARAAVLGALDELAEAYARHDNSARPHEELTAAVRHAIEAQTFTPRRGAAGVHLVDAVAARFGEFAHAHLVGLVETDWPERPRRNIFYTAGMLQSLGWPQEPDQTRVQHAVFTDLLALPSKTVTLHAFQLEGDAIVALSPLVELARDVASEVAAPPPHRRTFADEVLTGSDVAALPASSSVDAVTGAAWLAQRIARGDLRLPRYGGFVEPQPAQRYRVSRVDRYVDCPFKYFAENVLRLPEEREEMAGLSPLERGNLVHALFESFYRTWQASGRGTITAETLPEAVQVFAELTENHLSRFPEADRALERSRLLGSLVAPGLAERVFELEADRGGIVTERLLEEDVKGPFTFPVLGGLKSRTVEISGKADRIDVFDDGSLRVVDYKLSKLPDTKASIQIAVYAWAAQQLLEARDGRPHAIADAMYLAFGDEDRFAGAMGHRDEPAARAVEARVAEFARVIDRIEAGEFPPAPRKVGDCAWCRYAGVCRKEYREGSDETAEPV